LSMLQALTKKEYEAMCFQRPDLFTSSDKFTFSSAFNDSSGMLITCPDARGMCRLLVVCTGTNLFASSSCSFWKRIKYNCSYNHTTLIN
ncbi:hypothetical protein T10_3382, partial [Trichinella papuae]